MQRIPESTTDMNLDLTGRIAIVTGASRRVGIGAATCQALAQLGADICFTHWGAYDRGVSGLIDDDGPSALMADLERLGRRVLPIEADLSDPATPNRIIAQCQRELGQPTILVNNAAYSTRDGWEHLDAATLDAHYAVNVRGMALLCVAFTKAWPGGTGGRIINLTSGQDLGPMPSELAYVATKGAVSAFSRTLAHELGPRGITVNTVNPGPTDTGWMDDDLKAVLEPRFPLGRIGLPTDTARLIAFLASDAASWITGQVLNSTGGFG